MIKNFFYAMMIGFCFTNMNLSFANMESYEVLQVKQKNTYNLVLYINPNCPYCQKVTRYLQSQGRTVPTKNTQDRSVRNELISIGGKGQVPCLVIDGKALYESDAIIEWFKSHP